MDSETRSVNIRLRIGDEPESDALQALRLSVKIGHGPAAEQSNFLQSLGVSEADIDNKPLVMVECEDAAAAEGVVELLKALPDKAEGTPLKDLVEKVKPDFRVQGTKVIIACGDAPVPSEFIESIVEEVPEQALNADNLIELCVRTA